MRRRSNATRCVALLIVLAVVVAACRPDQAPVPDDDPPSDDAEDDDAQTSTALGADIAVVLPPRNSLDEALATAIVERLETMPPQTETGTLEVRAVLPETSEFVDDLVDHLAGRGTRIVCVIGPDAVASVSRAVRVHRATRFCAASAPPMADDAVLGLELRAAELGHAAGIAARRRAGEGPVGLVLGGAELPSDAFAAGLQAGLAGIDVVAPDDTSASFGERVASVMQSEPTVVVVDGAPGSSDVAQLVGPSVSLLGPTDVLADADEGQQLMTWRVRWEVVVRAAFTTLIPGGDAPKSFGGSEGVFDLAYGGSASKGIREDVRAAFDGFADGSRNPLERDPGQALPSPSPSPSPSG